MSSFSLRRHSAARSTWRRRRNCVIRLLTDSHFIESFPQVLLLLALWHGLPHYRDSVGHAVLLALFTLQLVPLLMSLHFLFRRSLLRPRGVVSSLHVGTTEEALLRRVIFTEWVCSWCMRVAM